MSEWLSVRRAAERLGLDESTIYRLCASRKIPHRRMGDGAGKIVFTEADLSAYLESCVVPVGAVRPVDQPPPIRLKHLRPQGSRRA